MRTPTVWSSEQLAGMRRVREQEHRSLDQGADNDDFAFEMTLMDMVGTWTASADKSSALWMLFKWTADGNTWNVEKESKHQLILQSVSEVCGTRVAHFRQIPQF